MQLFRVIRVQPASVFARISTVIRILIGILVLSFVVSCGRADTSANSPETVAPVATATTAAYPMDTPEMVAPAATTTTAAYPINTTTIPISLTPEAIAIDYPAYELGIVVDQSMTVLHVEAGGAVDQAGIRSGDRLLTVDDIPVATAIDKIKEHIRQPASRAIVRVKIVRGNQEIELSVQPNFRPARTTTPTPVVPPNDYL